MQVWIRLSPEATVNLLMVFQLSGVLLRFSISSLSLFYLFLADHMEMYSVYTQQNLPNFLTAGLLLCSPFYLSELAVPGLLLRALVF